MDAKISTHSTGGEKEMSWHHKGHHKSINIFAFLYHQREIPSGYMALGLFLFL